MLVNKESANFGHKAGSALKEINVLILPLTLQLIRVSPVPGVSLLGSRKAKVKEILEAVPRKELRGIRAEIDQKVLEPADLGGVKNPAKIAESLLPGKRINTRANSGCKENALRVRIATNGILRLADFGKTEIAGQVRNAVSPTLM